MSDFYKKFLLEDPRRTSYGGRYVCLAAFGKHPGWDDHIEPLPGRVSAADLGLETESLNLAKTVLYVNGIGGQIDSGAWEKLDATQQFPSFNHIFVWQRSGQILIGRLWSSSDGKGRKRYPMVVCAHLAGVPLGWALKHVLPALAEIEEGCVKTSAADDVRALLNRKRAALREAIQSADGHGEYAPVTPETLNKILRPAGNAVPEEFLRVLYQMQSQLGAFTAGTFNTRANSAAIRAQQIRVPVAGENPEQSLLFWTRFYLTQIDPAVPVLLTLPLHSGWMDVTAGEPKSHEFFCLRASPKAVPLVSEVPYKLDEAFRTKAAAFLEGFHRGETKVADLKIAAAPVSDAPPPPKSGWMKWVGLFIILGVVAVFLLLPGKQELQTGKETSQTNAEVVKVEVAALGTSKAEDAQAKARKDAEIEAVRLAEEKKKSDAIATAKLKAEAETAAKDKELKEKQRQMAETARIEKEKAAAKQKELEAQQRKTEEEAAAKKKADEESKSKLELAAAAAKTPDPKPVATSAQVAAQPGEVTNGIGMLLLPLPSGIWAGKYEVTQAEYRKVMGEKNPSKSLSDGQPVESITWNDANEFCRKLTEMERGKLPDGRYTLPTEAQWKEFHAGQRFEELPGKGLTGKGSPASVGQSAPANKLGLFDVLGNVWEWCLDDATGNAKLLKGGAFDSANYDRTLLPGQQAKNCGFRCVLVPSK